LLVDLLTHSSEDEREHGGEIKERDRERKEKKASHRGGIMWEGRKLTEEE
jgi:hypothetical protein